MHQPAYLAAACETDDAMMTSNDFWVVWKKTAGSIGNIQCERVDPLIANATD
jgi:hypothetical protein